MLESQDNSSPLSYPKKVKILCSLVDKMFIIHEDSDYILRIENSALPMSEFQKQKESLKLNENETEAQLRKEELKELSRRRDRIAAYIENYEEWADEAIQIQRFCNTNF
jgi:molecular chaperone GrpE (heat shock protein)